MISQQHHKALKSCCRTSPEPLRLWRAASSAGFICDTVFLLEMSAVLSAPLRGIQQSTDGMTACSAYDFGFNNPQYSDRVLHIWQERDACGAESQPAEKQAVAPRLLRRLHVNSLALAANSEVFRLVLRMARTHCFAMSSRCPRRTM